MAVQLHHRVSGRPDRPTVVLSGSIGSTIATWASQVTALTDDFHVITIDHRGHGGSPAPTGPYALADLAEDVLRLLDTYDVEHAHLVGLSLGAMVAQRIAAHHPDRVDRVALLCTAAHYTDRQPWIERAATVRAGGVEAVADVSLERWLTPGYRAEHPAVLSRLREMLVGVDREGYAGCCEAIADMDLRDGLSRIQAPTLVIAGAEDPAAPPDQLRELAAAIPGARFVVVPGAHVPTIEHPETVTELLREHLLASISHGSG